MHQSHAPPVEANTLPHILGAKKTHWTDIIQNLQSPLQGSHSYGPAEERKPEDSITATSVTTTNVSSKHDEKHEGKHNPGNVLIIPGTTQQDGPTTINSLSRHIRPVIGRSLKTLQQIGFLLAICRTPHPSIQASPTRTRSITRIKATTLFPRNWQTD